MYHTKDDQRNRVSCDLLYRSLSRLIDQVGFENINVKVLAATAGVGRATFYRSFDAIEDVLRYQTDLHIIELTESIYCQLKEKPVFTERDIYSSFFGFCDSRRELLRILIRAKQYWLFEKSMNQIFMVRLSFIKSYFNLPDPDWQYFIRIRTAMLTAMLEEWVESGESESPDQLVEILLKSFTHVEINPEEIFLPKPARPFPDK
ncbi:MAG: TetR/AcrR family transcriptional regulator [Anaerolineaceae bacterium]